MAGRLRNVVQVLAGAEDSFILWYIQIGCKAHPASCSMGNKDSFARGKVAESWSWTLISK